MDEKIKTLMLTCVEVHSINICCTVTMIFMCQTLLDSMDTNINILYYFFLRVSSQSGI